MDVCYARIFHRLEVRSPPCLPRRGPAILVCNHISGLDPLLIQAVCPRLIVWMMAKEYYEQPLIAGLIRRIEAIPLARQGRAQAATRQAMRALAKGRVLGIFPEGRIETSRELLPFQTGVAMIALRTATRVYPAFLDGSQRGCSMMRAYLRPQHARLAFGPPLELDASPGVPPDLDSATNSIYEAVDRLRTRALDEKFQNKS